MKRVLVCAPTMPAYDREGGSRRVFHFISCLRNAGHAVAFFAFNGTDGDRYAHVLQQMGVPVYVGPHTTGAGDNYVSGPEDLVMHGQFDLAIIAFWHVAEYLIPILRSLSPRTVIAVDSIDLHLLRHARRIFLDSESPVLDDDYASEMVRELNTYAAADYVLTVSNKEAAIIGDFIGRPERVVSIPLMEDMGLADRPFAARRGILFVGNFSHPPNFEAARYLCDNILPLVDPTLIEVHPLSIVGNGAERHAQELAQMHPRVRLVGWVPSLEPYYHQARVSVVPVLHGAGTKTKLIQTAMTGTPAVSTTIGAEGLNLVDREHALIADSPPDFAEALTTLLADPTLWQRIATQARAHIAAVHGRDAVFARLRAFVDAALSGSTALPPP
jgi:O-antigen biosynthesis protein